MQRCGFLLIICFVTFNAGIYITFVGNAETLWSENSGDKRIAYRGKECYLSKRIYFVGEEDGNSMFHLLWFPFLFKTECVQQTFIFGTKWS